MFQDGKEKSNLLLKRFGRCVLFQLC